MLTIYVAHLIGKVSSHCDVSKDFLKVLQISKKLCRLLGEVTHFLCQQNQNVWNVMIFSVSLDSAKSLVLSSI